MSKNMPTIAILEDNNILRQTMEDYLQLKDYNIVFSGGKYAEFINDIKSINPQFILLDIHLDDALGTDIIGEIKRKAPKSNVIMITGDNDKDLLLKGMENGASAFIYKPFRMEELEKVIGQVRTTGSFLEPDTLTRLLGLINEKQKAKNAVFEEELTPREEDLLYLIKKGHSCKEMADLLSISFHTVNHHLKNLYLKTDVKSKKELIAKYFQN